MSNRLFQTHNYIAYLIGTMIMVEKILNLTLKNIVLNFITN